MMDCGRGWKAMLDPRFLRGRVRSANSSNIDSGMECYGYRFFNRFPSTIPARCMALRYRRRIKIIPGVHLNISKSGISTSIGVRGASMTFGKRGRYANVGIPGSGIYWRSRVGNSGASHAAPTILTPSEERVASGPGPATMPIHTHHLHWWKVLLFFALAVVAGATKSDPIIGIFWIGWFAYWGFLLVRLIVRKSRGAQAV